MHSPHLAEELNRLVRKYREFEFVVWEKPSELGNHHFNDYATCEPDDTNWWQAHTDVLEIVEDAASKRWALVSIVLYPYGIHSFPPALASALAVFEDGRVEGAWADGERFVHQQVRGGCIAC